MKARVVMPLMLLIAIIMLSVFAMLPVLPARAIDDEDPFQYSYPYVPGPPPNCAWIGQLQPGESTPWVTVTVTVSGGGVTFPITQTDGWHATLELDDTPIDWLVTANPGPTYTWDSLTSTVVVNIKVTVPSDWPEGCVTFRAKLWPGLDSSKNPKSVGSGDGVHFKVCVKPKVENLKIECKSFMTDSSFNPISSFDTVWTPKDPKGRDYYKLSSTNPGQFMYNIWIHNIGTVNVEKLEVTYTIDGDFVLKGADPIQVWTGYGKTGTRIWNVTIVGNVITIGGGGGYMLVPGAELWITFHLQYKWDRQYFTAAQMMTWKADHDPNIFSCAATAYATGYDPYVCTSPDQTTTLPDPMIVLGVEG